MKKKYTIPYLLGILFLALVPLHAIEKAAVEFQGWGGVNIATKSTYSTDFTGASFVKPTFGLTVWASQPFVLRNNLDLGLSAGYLPVFALTQGSGNESSITAFPILLEARYRLPYNFFIAAGGGYAYTRLKLNNETANTNAAILSLKGGYQYEILKNLSAVGTLHLSYLLQTLTFPGAGEKSNSQFNVGATLGVAYKL